MCHSRSAPSSEDVTKLKGSTYGPDSFGVHRSHHLHNETSVKTDVEENLQPLERMETPTIT